MKHIIKIVTLSLLAVLLLPACRKRHHTPDPQDQKVPISFTAQSQDAAVKSATKATFPDGVDFGVWGIARHNSIAEPYVLWLDGMEQVTKKTDGSYAPATDAYWLRDYTYRFLAVAPYSDGPTVTVPSQPSATSTDKLTFTFDMGEKYKDSEYDFDLMGAAATSTVDANHKKGSQDLTFWHLLSRIVINVSFDGVDDGTVEGMRLSNILTKADYTVSFDSGTQDTDYPLKVVYETSTKDRVVNPLGLDSGNYKDEEGWIVHIVPQVTKDFDLYLDFKVGEIETTNFKVNLSSAGNTEYEPNSQYNWNITISPKTITFDVEVESWGEGGSFDFDIQ